LSIVFLEYKYPNSSLSYRAISPCLKRKTEIQNVYSIQEPEHSETDAEATPVQGKTAHILRGKKETTEQDNTARARTGWKQNPKDGNSLDFLIFFLRAEFLACTSPASSNRALLLEHQVFGRGS
jgi:hypothetical protein